jgi:hypothetical protein
VLCLAAWAAPFLSVVLKPRDYPIFDPATPSSLIEQVQLWTAQALFWGGFPMAFAAFAIACARLASRFGPASQPVTRRAELSSFVLVLIVLASSAYLAACTWVSFIHDFD